MWLAWAHGAALVPAPRALVRSGVELGPWLKEHRITVISTVPTLAGIWDDDALSNVRLLILGGEACPEHWSSAWPRAASCGIPTARPRRPSSPPRSGWSPARR